MCVQVFSRITLAVLFSTMILVGTGFADNGSRAVDFFNSTQDVQKVRIHCLHFDGRVFFKDVAKDSMATQANVGFGDRAIVVYRLDGTVLTHGKLKLGPGDEPAKVGVFGNDADGYRVDVSP